MQVTESANRKYGFGAFQVEFLSRRLASALAGFPHLRFLGSVQQETVICLELVFSTTVLACHIALLKVRFMIIASLKPHFTSVQFLDIVRMRFTLPPSNFCLFFVLFSGRTFSKRKKLKSGNVRSRFVRKFAHPGVGTAVRSEERVSEETDCRPSLCDQTRFRRISSQNRRFASPESHWSSQPIALPRRLLSFSNRTTAPGPYCCSRTSLQWQADRSISIATSKMSSIATKCRGSMLRSTCTDFSDFSSSSSHGQGGLGLRSYSLANLRHPGHRLQI